MSKAIRTALAKDVVNVRFRKKRLKELENKGKISHWVIDPKRFGDACHRCNACGAVVEDDVWDWHNFYYCYHCGRDMQLFTKGVEDKRNGKEQTEEGFVPSDIRGHGARDDIQWDGGDNGRSYIEESF